MARMRKINDNGPPPPTANDRPDLDAVTGDRDAGPSIIGAGVRPMYPHPPLGLPPRRVAASARAKAQGLCCDYTKAPWYDEDEGPGDT